MAVYLAQRVTFKNFAVVKPAAAWFRGLRADNFEYSTKKDTAEGKTQATVSGMISWPTEDIKSTILQSALDFIPQHGWTWKSIAAGANSLGLSSVAHGLFPGGSLDLITYFYLSSNDELERQLESNLQKNERRAITKEKSAFIQDAVWRRILLLEPYKTRWVQALGILALPQNVPVALSNLGDLLNVIWHYAGDMSVDMSWYSKRAALAALYQSSELVFLQDKSMDYAQTQEFLNRRIKEFTAVNNCLEQVNQVSGTAKDVAELGFATLKNVLGMNTR
ncbi:ubiquinone biosynthesis protein COQ9, mitochondrial [Dermacentor albipictus]|uniref:ubiquinone biosynthesis protein COQ9, mitochondrial n=1 Tax=Dermacentor albipictus TaxID=60249 RepID=UPI0038FC71A9